MTSSTPSQTLAQYLRRLIWLCLVPLSLATALMALDAIRRVHDKSAAEVSLLATRLSQDVDADLKRRIYALEAIAAASAEDKGPLLEELHLHAQGYDKRFGDAIVVANAERQMLLHSRVPFGSPLPPMPKPPERNALAEALATRKPAISDVLAGAVLNKPVIAIATPISEKSPGMALATSIEAQRFQHMLQQAPIPPTWRVALIDSAGQAIAEHGFDRGIFDSSSAWQGRDAVRSISEAPWTVRVHAPAWPFFLPHAEFVAFFVIGLGLTIWVTIWVARRSSQRLLTAGKRLTAPLQPNIEVLTERSESESNALPANNVLRIVEIEAAFNEIRRLERSRNLDRTAAQERERKRIARDLHDSLQQTLASIQMDIEVGRRQAISGDLRCGATMDSAVGSIHIAMAELDQIVHELSPPDLRRLGLRTAIEVLANRLSRTESLDIELEFAGEDRDFNAIPEHVANGIYRLAQECLNNVRKHAKANFVYLLLDVTVFQRVVLQVSDDGVGIKAAGPSQPRSFGVRGMQERVTALGGWLHMQSRQSPISEFGTTVTVTLPLDPAQADMLISTQN